MSLTNPFVAGQLSEAVSLLHALETEFRSRSGSEEDSEVSAILLAQADIASSERDSLLKYSSGDLVDNGSGNWLLRLPVAVAPAHVVEEQTLVNLIFAFTALNAKRASFAVLSQVAKDLKLNPVGAEQAADAIYHLLPTRSKIAFNMLTPNEIDPAVDTKSAVARIT